MNKEDIKDIIRKLENGENGAVVRYLLGKVDMMDDKTIAAELQKINESKDLSQLDSVEAKVRAVFEGKIAERMNHHNEEKYPINDMFTYGIAGNCIHLHLPGDLHQLLKEKGMSKTMDMVNLNLLDAIDRIHTLKTNGFPRFDGKDSIYMISPILISREMKFLEDMDFKVQAYRKSELKNAEFVQQHPEAQLAVHIFGQDRNVGTALINLDTIGTQEWQAKKKAKVQEFAKKGIVLAENDKIPEK